jgi:3-phosphoshikimate 1-carboxyvinyltransferase
VAERIEVPPSRRVRGLVVAPGDKSISHRALLLSALAEGRSSIVGLSRGEDVEATARIITQLGAGLEPSGDEVAVEGGRRRLGPTSSALDCGNSGTTMRLVMGLVASIDGRHELVGDASLSRRPMDRVAIPLRVMGAEVTGVGEHETPPILVEGGPLRGIDYDVPVPSAQVKSAVLLAGLAAAGPTSVREALATRPNTEEMLAQAGASIRIETDGAGRRISLTASSLTPQRWQVPADPSQAAFFVVAGLLAEEGELRCDGLYGDASRTGYLRVLERMGALLAMSADENGNLRVVARSSAMRASTVDAAEIPSVDEVPILAVAAAAAEGLTRFVDVGELRIKESDRFEASLRLARGLGAEAQGEGDDLLIKGLGSARRFRPLEIDADGDHRIAMAAAIAGLVGHGASIGGFEAVATSYPGFLEQVEALR